MLLSYLNLQQSNMIIIEGKVVCNSDVPLQGAKVFFVPRLEETMTSDDGEFKLGISMPFPLTLIVNHEKYESCRVTIYNCKEKHIISLKNK